MLRAAEHGLYLSACDFFNFGVKMTNDATEHIVVIIDAGGRGLDCRRWTKGEVNKRFMARFWQWAAQECALDTELQCQWRRFANLEECLRWAENKWQRNPILTTKPVATNVLQQRFTATEQDNIKRTTQSNQYKILRMIGTFV